jgi:hypothetical protein
LDGNQKRVTALRRCFNEARVVGIIAQRQANLADGGVQADVEVDKAIRRPELLLQRLPRDQSPCVGKQLEQYAERKFLELGADAVFAKHTLALRQFELSKAEDAIRRRRG